jgi:predicted GNAT family acetyltransferase
MESVEIRHDEARHRYELVLADEVIGLSKYRENGEQRVFLHTEVDPEYQGHGLATQLIVWALDDTRAAGKRIVAICPMITAYVAKHHEYDDILDPRDVTPA